MPDIKGYCSLAGGWKPLFVGLIVSMWMLIYYTQHSYIYEPESLFRPAFRDKTNGSMKYLHKYDDSMKCIPEKRLPDAIIIGVMKGGTRKLVM